MADTLHEDQYIFSIISRSILLRMKNILDKSCRETRNAHFMFNNFFSENRAVYEIVWKKSRAGQATDDNVCWIPKATKCTHKLCNTYCFSIAAVVARTRLIARLVMNTVVYGRECSQPAQRGLSP